MFQIRAHNLERVVEDIKKIVENRLDHVNFIEFQKAEVVEFYEENAYGIDFYENLAEILFTELPKNPEILIIKGFDDICKKCSRRITGECSIIYEEHDITNIATHGLEVGKRYSVKEILLAFGTREEDIKKYFQRASKPSFCFP